jgi:hypothetical protein
LNVFTSLVYIFNLLKSELKSCLVIVFICFCLFLTFVFKTNMMFMMFNWIWCFLFFAVRSQELEVIDVQYQKRIISIPNIGSRVSVHFFVMKLNGPADFNHWYFSVRIPLT